MKPLHGSGLHQLTVATDPASLASSKKKKRPKSVSSSTEVSPKVGFNCIFALLQEVQPFKLKFYKLSGLLKKKVKNNIFLGILAV